MFYLLFLKNNLNILGARLFTSCPIDFNGSQAWFTDLWNYSILPFIIENLREHVKQNGGKLKYNQTNSFVDPTDWIVSNYPWNSNAEWSDHLNRLRLEDIEVACDGKTEIDGKLAIGSGDMKINNNLNNYDSSLMNSIESTKDIKDPFVSLQKLN